MGTRVAEDGGGDRVGRPGLSPNRARAESEGGPGRVRVGGDSDRVGVSARGILHMRIKPGPGELRGDLGLIRARRTVDCDGRFVLAWRSLK